MTEDVFRLSSRFAQMKSSPVRDILAVLGRGDIISFAGGIPDPTLFELADFRESFAYVLEQQGRRALQYASTIGEPELREQAARRLSRYLPTTAAQIQVTSGSQEGLYLVATTLIDPGDVVLVERPTYLTAVQAFTLVGARMVGVESDEYGMMPDALADAIETHDPKLVYLVPTFQNPTGRTMSAERRAAIAEVLVRTGVPLLEDDPYGELRFEGDPLAPITAQPGMAQQTVLLNSASKVMAPGVRIGWLRAEGQMLRSLEIAKQGVGLQTAVTDQLAIAHYLATYDLDAHIARVADVYRARRDAMLASLDARMPAGATATRPEGGMFVWVRLGGDVDSATVLPHAVDRGVAFVPGWPFYANNPDRTTMRLSFVTNSPETISEGVDRLAAAWGW
ncbi:MAG TPA: PLP-dependent aminotransferase family protein [Propionibacteriaceae bacterium]|nr:PLP-dependent aminotransferase family protein [Propionibacteriaceae bacterium]